MPLLTLHLLSLVGSATREGVLEQLLKERQTVETVVASIPRYWVCKPEKDDVATLVNTRWDLMLLLKTPDGDLPSSIQSKIVREYKVTVGIPSKLLAKYPETNRDLLAKASSVPLTGALDNYKTPESSQNLELSPDLFQFMGELVRDHPGPVTMLNLLHFKPDGKSSYYEYGQGFQKAGGKRGGNAKIVGNVVPPPSGQSDSRGESSRSAGSWWNEIAIVHYPSLRHFCDMAAGEDYQAINQKYRLPALEDTILLCTTEIDLTKFNSRARL